MSRQYDSGEYVIELIMQFLIERNSNLIPKPENCNILGMRLICTSCTPPSSCCHSSSCVQNVEVVARYIQQQNRDIYERCGVTIGDPMDRGLRCVSSWHLVGLNFPRHSFVSTLESQLGGGSKEIGSWQLVVMAIDSYQWAILRVVEWNLLNRYYMHQVGKCSHSLMCKSIQCVAVVATVVFFLETPWIRRPGTFSLLCRK